MEEYCLVLANKINELVSIVDTLEKTVDDKISARLVALYNSQKPKYPTAEGAARKEFHR